MFQRDLTREGKGRREPATHVSLWGEGGGKKLRGKKPTRERKKIDTIKITSVIAQGKKEKVEGKRVTGKVIPRSPLLSQGGKRCI